MVKPRETRQNYWQGNGRIWRHEVVYPETLKFRTNAYFSFSGFLINTRPFL
jgi:hypothetical protein